MKFFLDEDVCTVTFEGFEQFLALKRKLVIPKSLIVGMDWQENIVIQKSTIGLRIGGVGLPGALYAGRFNGKDGRTFLYIRSPKREGAMVRAAHILSIELPQYYFHHIWLTVDDFIIAQEIIAWWRSPNS